jgi:hypothetical protein
VAAPVDKPTLEFYQQNFIVRQGGRAFRVPIKPPPEKPTLFVAYRRNQTYAVWDERGLTIRVGQRVRSSRLEHLSVSPKVFTREEIRETLGLMAKGQRSKKASWLAGSKRLGNFAYFLVRWNDRSGRAWLETLVRVDLTGTSLWPELVGQFEGISRADRPLDNRMTITGGKLAVVTQSEDRWGVATYDPRLPAFDFRSYGYRLGSFLPKGRFIERTSYGTYAAGSGSVARDFHRLNWESRLQVRWLDEENPGVVVGKAAAWSAASGALLPITPTAGLGRAGSWIVVFEPADAPQRAVLYESRGWAPVAQWRAGQQR